MNAECGMKMHRAERKEFGNDRGAEVVKILMPGPLTFILFLFLF